MKVTGIIAEYNPLHNGHIYQLEAARDAFSSDAIVVILGGDFTQRGLPAIADRHVRAAWALSNGADLVLGMPIIGSCDSAESFARSGVCALEQSGIVTDILFGIEGSSYPASSETLHDKAENDDLYLKDLKNIADLLSLEELSDTLRSLCAKGLTYPAALSQIISDRLSDESAALASSPNNILAIEYLRSLNILHSDMVPHALSRYGAGHDEIMIPDISSNEAEPLSAISRDYSSSTAIRTALETASFDALRPFVTESIYNDLYTAAIEGELIFPIDIALLLSERLIAKDDYSDIYGCSKDLSNRIRNLRDGYQSYYDFAESLKTKNLTRTHIDRALCHILLGITDDDAASYKAFDCCPYLNVLGIGRGTGEKLLSDLTRSSSVPVITSPKDVSSLSAEASAIYKKDLYACDLYRILKTQKSGRTYPTEYTRRFTVI